MVKKPRVLTWERKDVPTPEEGIAFAWVARSPNFGWWYRVIRNRNHRYDLWIMGEWNDYEDMAMPKEVDLPYYIGEEKSAPKGKEIFRMLDRLFLIWYRRNRRERSQ